MVHVACLFEIPSFLPSPCKLRILQIQKHLIQKHHASINHISKAIYCRQRYRKDPLNNFVNLSKKTFTYNEFRLLNKRLKLLSNPREYNKSKYTKDINDFIRRIKLEAHFKTTQPLAKKDVVQFTKSSSEKNWISKETHHTIESFIEAFNKELEIEEKNKKTIPKSNLTKRETDTLQELSQ